MLKAESKNWPGVDADNGPAESSLGRYSSAEGLCPDLAIPMMPISHSDLMPIRSERSDAGLSQCETVIGIRQEVCLFSWS